ncbi:N4-gp56 family major capsid protein, partial [Candidatus Pacearchaeota archaeon]|nr:N4-gp56 family major capsid protein [Candidatus Pacearchaeota archaeon]
MALKNPAANFSDDVEAFIAEKTLPLVQRRLVAYQFGDQLTLPKGRGTTYTASRYTRVSLPFAPLSEGVPPQGQALVLEQVSASAQQWGDTITIPDVAGMTIKHPLFEKAIDLLAMQQVETCERNTMNALMAGTQVNFVNSRGSRDALVSGDVMDSHEINRVVGALRTIGAPEYLGQKEETAKVTVGKPSKASANPAGHAHYVSVMHTDVEMDMREDAKVVTAWSYSDINRLYNSELGEWGGVRFCRSNMVPTVTGAATVAASPVTSGGALADGTYYVKVTEVDPITQYETIVHQVSGAVTISGGSGAGSITLTAPTTTEDRTCNVYVSLATTTLTLGKSVLGPTTGPMAGQAIQIPSAGAVVITDLGTAQTPPAAPATGVKTYPTFIFGRNAYGIVMLDNVKFKYLSEADKVDPLNQLRIAGWK